MESTYNSLPPVLLVDDDPVVLELTITTLQSQGLKNVNTLDQSRNLIPFLRENPVSAIVLDIMMPDLSGTDLLPQLSRDFPYIPVIVMTSLDETGTAVTCMKAGAFDFVTKPVQTERLISSVEKALQVYFLRQENCSLRQCLFNDCLQHPDEFSKIITNSKKLRTIFQYIEVIAKSDQPVLITGETGVGKELIARSIAAVSGKSGPFVTVNAAGLDDAMFTDTLFGHKKGAFTGADLAREGLVGSAAGGSLFLDEIGDLSESSQIKLLRLIQEREYYPTGSDTIKKSDARLIMATNKDLHQLIEAGKFRKDLFYRLCAHQVHIPPLRERREDIPLLLNHFVGEAAESLKKKKPVPYPEVAAMLSTYHFDGNVRELQAMVFDAVARSSDILSLDCFPALAGDFSRFRTQEQASLNENDAREAICSLFGRFPTIKEVEDYLISAAMDLTNGNQKSAASMLGIARQTLSKRLSGAK